MADAVTVTKLAEDRQTVTYHLTNISDGTGESAVQKVDKSGLAGFDGATEPLKLKIWEIRWAISGFTAVQLLADHTTDDVLMVLAGNGYEDFGVYGGKADPASAGGTGDILLTTAGASADATYDITVTFWKEGRVAA